MSTVSKQQIKDARLDEDDQAVLSSIEEIIEDLDMKELEDLKINSDDNEPKVLN